MADVFGADAVVSGEYDDSWARNAGRERSRNRAAAIRNLLKTPETAGRLRQTQLTHFSAFNPSGVNGVDPWQKGI
jgi:hypothetical protein